MLGYMQTLSRFYISDLGSVNFGMWEKEGKILRASLLRHQETANHTPLGDTQRPQVLAYRKAIKPEWGRRLVRWSGLEEKREGLWKLLRAPHLQKAEENSWPLRNKWRWSDHYCDDWSRDWYKKWETPSKPGFGKGVFFAWAVSKKQANNYRVETKWEFRMCKTPRISYSYKKLVRERKRDGSG